MWRSPLLYHSNGRAYDFDTFWELLSSFDADIVFSYQRTGFDLSIENPKQLEEYIQHSIRNLIESGFDPVRAEEEVRKEFPRRTLDDGFIISESLMQQILLRLRREANHPRRSRTNTGILQKC